MHLVLLRDVDQKTNVGIVCILKPCAIRDCLSTNVLLYQQNKKKYVISNNRYII